MSSPRCTVSHGSTTRSLFEKGAMTRLRCDACRHAFLAEPDPRYGREKFDKIYHTIRSFDGLTTDRYVELLRRLDPHRSTGQLLDVGYGNAQFLVTARELGWKVSGTELSERAHGHATRATSSTSRRDRSGWLSTGPASRIAASRPRTSIRYAFARKT